VLITSASHALSLVVARSLSREFQIRVTDRTAVSSPYESIPYEFIRCALEQDTETDALVKGVEAIVHVAEPLPDDDEKQRLDWLTRGTYNLLLAASRAGVPRVVFLSTLDVMTAYDASYTVSESWRPLPSPAAGVLSKHLGEYVCREFARDRKIRATSLRLGKVVRQEETKGQPFDPLWVDERDVCFAVMQALKVTPKDNAQGSASWWAVYHITSDSARARFSIAGAKSALGYQPRVRW
jgi:nucleoside-diphosphate-sugar epimerase